MCSKASLLYLVLTRLTDCCSSPTGDCDCVPPADSLWPFSSSTFGRSACCPALFPAGLDLLLRGFLFVAGVVLVAGSFAATGAGLDSVLPALLFVLALVFSTAAIAVSPIWSSKNARWCPSCMWIVPSGNVCISMGLAAVNSLKVFCASGLASSASTSSRMVILSATSNPNTFRSKGAICLVVTP